MVRISGSLQNSRGIIGIVALNRVAAGTAVFIQINIAKLRRTGPGILRVQVDIGFAQTASHQTGKGLAAGITVQGEGANHITGLAALNDSLEEKTVSFVDPSSSQIVCKAYQRIVLILGQLQFILIDQLFIQSDFNSGQVIAEQHLGSLFADTVLLILLQHIRGTLGTVTHGHLAVILIGILAETLLALKISDAGITDGHTGCRGILLGRGAFCGGIIRIYNRRFYQDQTQHKNQRKQQTYCPFHSHMYSFRLNYLVIITGLLRYCNPFF